MTLTGTITPDQIGPGSHGNKRVLHITQNSRNRTSPGCRFVIKKLIIESKIQQYREKINNEVIQSEGEIYWETKLTLEHFGSNEPSSGLWGRIRVMLNQQLMFEKNQTKTLGKLYIYIYIHMYIFDILVFPGFCILF